MANAGKKLGEGHFLIRLLEIMLLLTIPTRKDIDIHKTIALNLLTPLQFYIAWSPVVAEVLMKESPVALAESPVALAKAPRPFVVLRAPLAPWHRCQCQRQCLKSAKRAWI